MIIQSILRAGLNSALSSRGFVSRGGAGSIEEPLDPAPPRDTNPRDDKTANCKRALSINFLYYFLFILGIFATACGRQTNTVSIGKEISFPTSLIPYSDKEFLLLNSNAANFYNDGSIHRYSLNDRGEPILENVFIIPEHALDIALSQNNKLLALSFDGSKPNTILSFYDMSDKNNPKLLSPLTLYFSSTGSKQSIKQLKFFKVGGFSDYFIYGVILSHKLDTGKGGFIPARTFVARISQDLSYSKVLFVLSYGVGDNTANTQTLALKSDSLKPSLTNDVQYMFGSNAPMYDAEHNLFIAFPTGSMNGDNNESINKVPQLPHAMKYFSGEQNANLNCPPDKNCVQPDLRAVSLFAVDMLRFLNNTPLNLSLYFVPLAWNNNGIPFGHKTKEVIIKLNSGKNSEDITSFAFQSNFWASYGLNSNSFLVAKNGTNSESDKDSGNEVFKLSGLDILYENIKRISYEIFYTDPIEINDFKLIANRQIIDLYHTLNKKNDMDPALKPRDDISVNWPVNPITQIQNSGPLSPYMHSRTYGSAEFLKTATAVYNFDTICSDPKNSDTCFPYWVRSSYLGFQNYYGRDSSWLTAQVPAPTYKPGDNPLYPDALSDPTVYNVFRFLSLSGARVCTTMQKTTIYCASFLTGDFTKLHFTPDGHFVEF